MRKIHLKYFYYSSITAYDPHLRFWVGRLYLVDQGRINSAMLHDSPSSSLVGTINQINSQTLFSILGNVVVTTFPWSIIHCICTEYSSSQWWCSSGCSLNLCLVSLIKVVHILFSLAADNGGRSSYLTLFNQRFLPSGIINLKLLLSSNNCSPFGLSSD